MSNNKRKLLGIPIWNQGENSVGATKPYLEYLKQFGTIILLAPDAFVPELDLLVLPGGKDVSNGNREDFSFHNSDNERFLEWFDANTLPKYIEAKIPIYGICRGAQAIVRYFDMPLVQNIWWDHGYSKDEEDVKAHKVLYSEECEKMAKANNVSLPKDIESFHHQGIFAKDVSDDFELLAVSDETNVNFRMMEFARHRTLPIIIQQGHPERSWAQLPTFLIKSLLNIK